MNFLRIIRALWGIGNLWARLAIIIVASWPVAVTFAALIGWPALTATVALLPLAAIIFGLIALIDPLVIGAIGAVWPRFLKALALVIGTELAIGVYFAAVPVASDRGLVPLALLLLLAILFLAMSGKVKGVISALVAAFVILTGIFLLGGREKAKERAKDVVEWASKPKPPVVTAPTSRTLELTTTEWVEVSIPRRHEFRTDPADTVLVRNLLGKEFMKTPDGKIIRMADMVRVESFGDPIPGLKLHFRAYRRPTKLVFSYWPWNG